MSTYSDFENGIYYLIREAEGDEIMLIKPLMESGRCVLLLGDDGDGEITFWKEKDDEVFEIVDELDEDQASLYESLFEDDEDDDYDV